MVCTALAWPSNAASSKLISAGDGRLEGVAEQRVVLALFLVVFFSMARKHPPVSGGKRPLCTLGVAPGRSRGIGGCARARCVMLAAADGTARG